MLYRQKSALVTLILILLIYGTYGAITLYGPPRSEAEMVTALIGITVVYVLVLAASHIALAVQHRRRELVDERDQEIERTSRAEAYHALSLGSAILLMLGLVGTPPLLIANAALLASACAEIVRLSVQLRLYARSE